MITAYTRDRLQAAADHHTLRSFLRFSGTATIVWGSLALLAGFVPPRDMAAIGLGLVMVAAGIWNRIQVHPSGILINAGIFMLVGLYNILGNVLGMGGNEAGFGGWAKLGVFQILWGFRSLARYPHFTRVVKENPAEPDARWIEEAIRDVRKVKLKDATDRIEFQTFPPHARPWKGRLDPEGALFVSRAGDQVMVAARHQLEIVAGPESKPGKPVKATFTIAGRTMKGAIKPESLERYRAWKGMDIGLRRAA